MKSYNTTGQIKMEQVKLYQARYYTKVKLTTKPWSFMFRIRFWP